MVRPLRGIFIAEGSSDMPISDIVEGLFFEKGVQIHLSRPDFSILEKVGKDVRSKLVAGFALVGNGVDLVVVHRDADNAGSDARRAEIRAAIDTFDIEPSTVPVIPVRMTEAWLLLDEASIRLVAGNPRGRAQLGLPKLHEVESQADPKRMLADCLLRAADVSGRRRERVVRRFSQHRKQLLERLDPHGPVRELSSWKRLVADIDEVAVSWSSKLAEPLGSDGMTG